jgi:dihydrodipicolinate synthase/N-acetylneuraminate lyase
MDRDRPALKPGRADARGAGQSDTIRAVQSLDDYLPRPGLSVPLVTVLDSRGRLLDDQQRALVNFLIQGGRGADVLFAAGTTGEWNRMDNQHRQAVCTAVVDECRRASNRVGRKIEAWAGITAHTRSDTLKNLEHALEIDADAAVVAPLSIGDCASPADFVEAEMGRVFERRGRALPVFLYDNAEISAPGKDAHLHTRDVKRMARLEYVRGIKVTAGKAVLGNYTRAASHFKLSHEFAIYAGDPYVIFDLFTPPDTLAGAIRHRWNRYITQRSKPYGVVAGPSNAMPREWQRAWRVCRAGNLAMMQLYEHALDGLRQACEFTRARRKMSPVIACYKSALADLGVIESEAVAEGTPALEEAQRREFISRWRELRRRNSDALEPGWLSDTAVRPAPQRARATARQNG